MSIVLVQSSLPIATSQLHLISIKKMSACLAVITTLGNSSSLFPTKTFRVKACSTGICRLLVLALECRLQHALEITAQRFMVEGKVNTLVAITLRKVSAFLVTAHTLKRNEQQMLPMSIVAPLKRHFFFQPEKPKHKNHNDAHTPSWTIILVVWILVVRFL